ncbi:MAG: class F sortase [Sporichthyaceae bacterium]
MARHSRRARIAGLATLSLAGALLFGVQSTGVAKADLIPLPDDLLGLPIPPLPPPLGPGPEEEPTPKPQPRCSTAKAPFVPKSMKISGVDDNIPVIALRRDRDGVPGVPSTSARGRGQMAFDLDSGIRPGDSAGNALLNAHTWPDGRALGNAMLAELQEGDRVIVRGKQGKLCYRVTDRLEVREGDPEIRHRYYDRSGEHQIAIVTCSGKRLGPGEWTHRTIWFASPIR